MLIPYYWLGFNFRLDRKPVEYKSVFTEIRKIQKVITEVNIKNNAAFNPEFPKELLNAKSFILTDSRPRLVLFLAKIAASKF